MTEQPPEREDSELEPEGDEPKKYTTAPFEGEDQDEEDV
jgi:hypothetical protein